MIRPEFLNLLKGLVSATGMRPLEPAECEFWYRCLSDLPDEALRNAVARFAMAGDGWPTVAKIRALADEAMHGQPVPAEDAFERLVAVVRRYGSYDPHGGIAKLDDRTKRALNACGGWMWACEMSCENRQIFAAQFRRAYESIKARELEHRRLPAAIRPAIENHPEASCNGKISLHTEERIP